jgi:hypothetical protein
MRQATWYRSPPQAFSKFTHLSGGKTSLWNDPKSSPLSWQNKKCSMVLNTPAERTPTDFQAHGLSSKPEAYLIDFENELSMQEITVPIELLLSVFAE